MSKPAKPSKADELRAAVRRTQERAKTPTPPVVEQQRTPKPSTRKVRHTVDLGAADHRDLRRWCDDTAEDLERSRVSGQEVIAALVGRLVRDGADGPLSKAIREDLRNQ